MISVRGRPVQGCTGCRAVSRARAWGRTLGIAIENVRDFPARARGAFMTVGNFDGVHRGHQALLSPPPCEGRRGRRPRAGDHVRPASGDLAAARRGPRSPRLAGARDRAAARGRSDRGRRLPDRALAARALGPRVLRSGHPRAARRARVGRRAEFRVRPRPAGGRHESSRIGAPRTGIDFEVVEGTRIDGELVSSSLIRRCLGGGRSRRQPGCWAGRTVSGA